MRVCQPRSSSNVRHYAPPPSGPLLPQSTRQKRSLSDMSAEHARQASTLSIDLPPANAVPSRPASPVLSSPLPAGPSHDSVESDAGPSPQSSVPVAPPAPARKRRAAAVAAESAIRQQLHSDSDETLHRELHPLIQPPPLQELMCDEDDSTIDSCLSLQSSTASVASIASTSAYITPEPRKRRSRRQRKKAEADTAAAAAPTSSSTGGIEEGAGVVIPTYLPPAVEPPNEDAAPTPLLRRSTRRLPKSRSLTSSPAAPSMLPQRRAVSLPALHAVHTIFHDAAIITSVLSALSLSSLLRLRCVSSSFLRASYTPAAWNNQHITVSDTEALSRLRTSTALFALLPSLTINLVSCPTASIDQELRALLPRLPSLRCLRLLNCMKLTKLGVDAVLYCGALTELTVQNCGGLQARCLRSLLDYRPGLGSTPQLLLYPDVPRDEADDAALEAARTGVLSAYRSAAFLTALSHSCFHWDDYYRDRLPAPRPLYDHRRLVRLDLTKYRNFRDESLTSLPSEHWHSFVALQHVNLRGCRELTDESMGCLADMALLSLDLSFCVQLTNQGMERLAGQYKPLRQSLTSLNLTSVILLTDGACEHMAAFISLSHIVLSQLPRLSDHGLMLLQNGPACLSIVTVDLSWCDRLVGDWLVSVGEGWTRAENQRRMGADFLDYFDGSHRDADDAEDGQDGLSSEVGRECDSDGDGNELSDARREAAVIGRRRAAQREKRTRTRELVNRSGSRQQVVGPEVDSDGDREMWSALRYVDVRYCHSIDVGSKVILSRLRPDVQLVWR